MAQHAMESGKLLPSLRDPSPSPRGLWLMGLGGLLVAFAMGGYLVR
jgi:hypothetical protein